jgi:hypothetical protein
MNKIQIIAGWWLLTFLVCLPTVNATEDTLSRFKDEGKKTFTFVQEFKYKHIKYKDTILTNYLDAPLDVNNGPDRQLVRFLSALRADDFAWWQSHWSVATRDDWENKVELNKARRMFNYWKRYVHPESTTELIDFVTMNSRVMIGFNVKDKETNYFLVPFVLENSRWRVDEPFMRSDLYRKLRAELVGS